MDCAWWLLLVSCYQTIINRLFLFVTFPSHRSHKSIFHLHETVVDPAGRPNDANHQRIGRPWIIGGDHPHELAVGDAPFELVTGPTCRGDVALVVETSRYSRFLVVSGDVLDGEWIKAVGAPSTLFSEGILSISPRKCSI